MDEKERHRTIGLNPLEEYISQSKQEQEVPKKEQEEQAELRQRITLQISSDIVERVKNAVYWEPGLTLAAFAQMALRQAIDELEAERGEPFPPRRDHNLRGGRPLK